MKILFLDIDGVLNSSDNMIVSGYLWEKNHDIKSRDKYGILFDERCVKWLTYIIITTGCDIVISSSWRYNGLISLQNMWKERNLPGKIIGCTPLDASEYIINLYAPADIDCRGIQIQEWIHKNNPEKYCIVDDDNDMLPNQIFVQTNPLYGLDKTTSMKIINHLL